MAERWDLHSEALTGMCKLRILKRPELPKIENATIGSTN